MFTSAGGVAIRQARQVCCIEQEGVLWLSQSCVPTRAAAFFYSQQKADVSLPAVQLCCVYLQAAVNKPTEGALADGSSSSVAPIYPPGSYCQVRAELYLCFQNSLTTNPR
jgi:hypothetical protein